MNWFRRVWPQTRRAGARERPTPRTVLVTGSSGAVAGLIVPLLEARGYVLRLVDRAGCGEQGVDLCDPGACDRAVAGVEAIVHLAGASKETTLERLFADNSVALGNLLRSAARAQVPRFVFASSMHVMGMYGRLERFDESDPPRPDSYYAASKLHGEALCRLFHEKAGLTVACLRLGSVTPTVEEADPGAWISPEDVVALVEVAFRLDVPTFEIFHAVAEYQGGPLPPSRAARYGYRCGRPGGDYGRALQTVQDWWHGNEPARTKRGASFAAGDLDDPA